MKKTLLTLVALLVIGFQFAGAQTYEVEYSGKFTSEDIDEMMKDPELSTYITDTVQLRKDFENVVLVTRMTMSEDKVKSEMDSSKSHFEMHMMGEVVDMNLIFGAMGFGGYADNAKGEFYINFNNPVENIKYLIKAPDVENPPYKEVEGTKTILGHECKAMETGKTYVKLEGVYSIIAGKVWYATDIPFKMKGCYKDVPGLILGMEMDFQGHEMVSFATSIKKTDKEITCPEGKIITLKEFMKMTGTDKDELNK